MYKVPMVVLLSAAAALPGGLVLALLARLGAVYYATSRWLGPVGAMALVQLTTLIQLIAVASPISPEILRHGPAALPRERRSQRADGALFMRYGLTALLLLSLLALASPAVHHGRVVGDPVRWDSDVATSSPELPLAAPVEPSRLHATGRWACAPPPS